MESIKVSGKGLDEKSAGSGALAEMIGEVGMVEVLGVVGKSSSVDRFMGKTTGEFSRGIEGGGAV